MKLNCQVATGPDRQAASFGDRRSEAADRARTARRKCEAHEFAHARPRDRTKRFANRPREDRFALAEPARRVRPDGNPGGHCSPRGIFDERTVEFHPSDIDEENETRDDAPVAAICAVDRADVRSSGGHKLNAIGARYIGASSRSSVEPRMATRRLAVVCLRKGRHPPQLCDPVCYGGASGRESDGERDRN